MTGNNSQIRNPNSTQSSLDILSTQSQDEYLFNIGHDAVLGEENRIKAREIIDDIIRRQTEHKGQVGYTPKVYEITFSKTDLLSRIVEFLNRKNQYRRRRNTIDEDEFTEEELETIKRSSFAQKSKKNYNCSNKRIKEKREYDTLNKEE